MFLVERLEGPSSFRPAFPQRLSYGSGDLVRAALMTSQSADPSPAPARCLTIQGELAFPAAWERKAG
jgi:hypothetical protein